MQATMQGVIVLNEVIANYVHSKPYSLGKKNFMCPFNIHTLRGGNNGENNGDFYFEHFHLPKLQKMILAFFSHKL